MESWLSTHAYFHILDAEFRAHVPKNIGILPLVQSLLPEQYYSFLELVFFMPATPPSKTS